MYNPENAHETQTFKPNNVVEGVITNIEDGTVRKFISNPSKWEGDLDAPAINVTVQFRDQDIRMTCSQVFTYKNSKDGVTEFSSRSNLGKFRKRYGHLPRVEQFVKGVANQEGFPKILL